MAGKTMMKLLLTDSGVKNPSIRDALVDLLGRPIERCGALLIPTAGYGHPMSNPQNAYQFISGRDECPMSGLGWNSLGVLELTALPSLDRERWVGWVQAADALLVNGGDALYLAHWMRESGLAELLPMLDDKVWVGLSGGSMVMTPRVGPDFVEWTPSAGDDRALGVVPFSIFPHLGHSMCPWNTMANAEKWASEIGVPAYATDDQTAIKVVDGTVDVVSEGVWKAFNL